MADSDSALYTLRYNQVSQAIEGQGGTPQWNALILSNTDAPPDHSITPVKISNTATDDFSFPRDVTAVRNLISDEWKSKTGVLKLVPTSSSTTAVQLFKSDGTTPTISISSLGFTLSMGTPSTEANIGIKVDGGTDSLINMRARNLSSGGNASMEATNDLGDQLSMLVVGSAFSTAQLQRKALLESTANAGLRICSTNASANISFALGGLVDASDKVYMTPAGQLSLGNASPDASAIVQADSTTAGILFPRMTTTQKNAISSPAEGLVVYDTSLHKLCVRVAAGWETITSA